jgi:RNA polymerase sigma factor (sigma-70 family)
MASSSVDSSARAGASTGPDDQFLIAGMLGGDAAALNKLMERYDRLVRYTVLRASRSRCVQDPHWLDTIASDTWTGFVRSMQRSPDKRPKSVRAYLVQIARYKCTGAMRSNPPVHESLSTHEDGATVDVAAPTEDPAELLSRMELLEALRRCLGELGPEEQKMASELVAITERRWRDAAANLGTSESTLRSRWKRVLERLRDCVAGKTGKTLAPGASGPDSLDGDG